MTASLLYSASLPEPKGLRKQRPDLSIAVLLACAWQRIARSSLPQAYVRLLAGLPSARRVRTLATASWASADRRRSLRPLFTTVVALVASNPGATGRQSARTPSRAGAGRGEGASSIRSPGRLPRAGKRWSLRPGRTSDLDAAGTAVTHMRFDALACLGR